MSIKDIKQNAESKNGSVLPTEDFQLMTSRVKTISKSVTTTLSPIDIFHGLCGQDKQLNSMLLESSEINSKADVKSILMLQSALRVECNGPEVKLTALTPNGVNALTIIKTQLLAQNVVLEMVTDGTSMSANFPNRHDDIDEDARLKQSSPIDVLRVIKKAFNVDVKNEYGIFLCGLFAFDFIANFETLPELKTGLNTCPDYVFYLAESLLVIDHQNNSKRLYSNHFSGDNQRKTYFELARNFELLEQRLKAIKPVDLQPEPVEKLVSPDITIDLSDAEFNQVVINLKKNIVAGDIFQVVPSRTFSLNCASPMESYRQLKTTNPSPYLFYMQDQDFILFGASPESALKYASKSNKVELYPIAGTRPRGKRSDHSVDLDLDARIEAELKLDKKELAEHMMLVDLARNDIARISKSGSTNVPKLLSVDRYSQVMHLVSCVQGELRADLDVLHAYLACMNMGTLTGAPKIKATQLIRQVEGKRRGSYGGAVGYINGNGDMDTCIVIRSAFYANGIAHVQAGAGIVYDSDPELESQETLSKAKAVINAVQAANNVIGGQTVE